MPNKPENNYRAWLAKAGEDELSAGALVEKEAGAPSTICFLSQQMGEKYLKGLLVFHNEEFLKVHDLLELETLLLDGEPEIQSLHEYCKTLNQYYVGTRYPGDVPKFTFPECKGAFESALRIKEFVLKKIAEEETTIHQKGFANIVL
ncbi:MAG: HEPN domain-containing protein, partial [Parcubacteria group bacterium Gr01-1014_66]